MGKKPKRTNLRPPGTCISGPIWNKHFHRVAASLGDATSLEVDRDDPNIPKNTQTICLGIGAVLLYAFQSTQTNIKTLPVAMERGLIKVWPPQLPRQWPPVVSFTDADAFNVANVLANYVTGRALTERRRGG
jgi:hypothetical protein